MRHMIESVSMINMRVLHIFGVVSLSHGNLHRVTSNVYTQRCRVGAVESSSIVLSIYDYRRRCPFLCVLNPHSHMAKSAGTGQVSVTPEQRPVM